MTQTSLFEQEPLAGWLVPRDAKDSGLWNNPPDGIAVAPETSTRRRRQTREPRWQIWIIHKETSHYRDLCIVEAPTWQAAIREAQGEEGAPSPTEFSYRATLIEETKQ